MKTQALVALLAASLIPLSASAQEWTQEQQEVWEFELSCQESKEAWIECIHEDYVGWSDLSLSAPARKADHEQIGGHWWDQNEVLFTYLKPVEIMVRGNFAVVQVVYTSTARNRETGEVVTKTEAWTDVCIRDNGRWYWISDHGTPLGDG